MKESKDKVELIDKANDVSAFASKNETRVVLNGVYVNGSGTEATDGRILIRVPYVQIDPQEYPPVENVTNEREPEIIPTKPFEEALKNVRPSSLPVLNCVRVSTVKRGNGKDQTVKAQLAMTDLENERVIESKVIDGNYPNLDAAIPATEPTLAIALGAEYLKRIADYALKHGRVGGGTGASIKFQFVSELDVVRFSIHLEDGRKAEGALMPVRLS